MDNVLVTVTGVQQDGEGDENRIELTTVGGHYEKNGIHYITYEETQLSGMEGTTTLLKVHREKVAVIRMGRVEHKQEFRQGEKTYSQYKTPYGTMKMAVFTSKVNVACEGAQGDIDIEYGLEIDGEWQSDNRLTVSIREERKNGC